MIKYFKYIIILSVAFGLSKESATFVESYYGGWPMKTIKNKEISEINCPGDLGCECSLNKDCKNGNCSKHLRGYYCSLNKGDIFPEFVGVDQFGETVSIKDFANEGKYILIEMGASWCSPCRELADWFSYGVDDITKKPFWKNEYNAVYDLVHNNDIYFITVLYEDEFRDTASLYTVEEWFNSYPDDNIPIIADENKYLHTILKPTGIPAVTLLDENLKIIELSNRGFNYSFDTLLKLLNSNNEDK